MASYGKKPIFRVDAVNKNKICLRINNNSGTDEKDCTYWECNFLLDRKTAFELARELSNWDDED